MRSAPDARVVVYALADYALPEHQTIEIFLTRAEAEAARCAVLADEPGWAGSIKVVEIALEAAKN
jgi:hypothetical protein